MKNEIRTINFEDLKMGDVFSVLDKTIEERIYYAKNSDKTALRKDYRNINFEREFYFNEKIDILLDIPEKEALNKNPIEEYQEIMEQNINKGKIIKDIKERYHGCLSEVQISPYQLIGFLEKFEPITISKMETIDSVQFFETIRFNDTIYLLEELIILLRQGKAKILVERDAIIKNFENHKKESKK
jgi:hypothetical protein